MAINARLTWSSGLRSGDIVKVRLLVQHPMETGYLQDLSGQTIKRNVIEWIRVEYDQREVFKVDTSSGIAANPFFEFYLRASVTGLVQVSWIDDAGVKGEYSKLLVLQS